MLNVKQESCEFQFYIFWFEPTENQNLVYWISNRRCIPSITDRLNDHISGKSLPHIC